MGLDGQGKWEKVRKRSGVRRGKMQIGVKDVEVEVEEVDECMVRINFERACCLSRGQSNFSPKLENLLIKFPQTSTKLRRKISP
jgi:hypothetical protein